MLSAAAAAAAKPFVVNTPGDDGGTGTLRGAILQADQSGGPAIITFDANVFPPTRPNVITLIQGPLVINNPSGDTQIQGPGAGELTLNGNNSTRIFEIDTSTTLSGLTLKGGNAGAANVSHGGSGGAILNFASLTLTSCDVTGNLAPAGQGGGILNLGFMSATQTQFSGNSAAVAGGAIYNNVPPNFMLVPAPKGIPGTATIKIDSCAISNNSAAQGGGIYNSARFAPSEVDIGGSKIAGNIAQLGGGIFNEGAGLTLTSSELVSNSAKGNLGGGLFNNAGNVTLTSDTFSQNASGTGTDLYTIRGPVAASNSTLGVAEVINATLTTGARVSASKLILSDTTFTGQAVPAAVAGNASSSAAALQPLGVVVPPNGGDVVVSAGSTLTAAAVLFTGNAAINISSDPTNPGTLALTGDVSFTGAGGTFAAIQSVGGAAAPGQVDLGGATRAFSVNAAGTAADLTLGATLMDGGIAKDSAGILRVTTPSSYAQDTSIVAGELEVDDPNALGTGNVDFNGGTLALRTSTPLPNLLQAAADAGMLLDVTGTAAQVTLGSVGAALDVTGPGGSLLAGGSVPLQHDLVVDTIDSIPVTLTGALSGAFGLIKAGPGTLVLAGAGFNSYAGTTTVDGGTLALDKSPGALAVPANVLINGPATVQLLLSSQLPPTAGVSFDDTSGAAVLDLNGHNQALASISSVAGPGTSLRMGTVTLKGATLTVGGAADFSYWGMISGPGTLIKTGAGRLLLGHSASAQNLSSLALNVASGSVVMTDPATGSEITQLTINTAAGAKLDLGRSPLSIINPVDPLAAIQSYIASAYHGGAWTGPGLTTSSGLFLGYADGSLHQIGLPIGTILVKPTLAGDATLDGKVDVSDLGLLATNFGRRSGATWAGGDFNYSGTVDVSDLGLLATNFGKSVPIPVMTALAATNASADLNVRRRSSLPGRRQ